MGKYDPLLKHLCAVPDNELVMTFDEIANIVGGLPRSAEQHPAWWANEAPGGRHVQARAWLDAGRQVVELDRAGRWVRFSRAEWRRGS